MILAVAGKHHFKVLVLRDGVFLQEKRLRIYHQFHEETVSGKKQETLKLLQVVGFLLRVTELSPIFLEILFFSLLRECGFICLMAIAYEPIIMGIIGVVLILIICSLKSIPVLLVGVNAPLQKWKNTLSLFAAFTINKRVAPITLNL